MTDPTERAVAATWTAHAILTALRGLGWRPTQAQPPPDWQRRDVPPAPPNGEYLAERARLLGEPQP